MPQLHIIVFCERIGREFGDMKMKDFNEAITDAFDVSELLKDLHGECKDRCSEFDELIEAADTMKHEDFHKFLCEKYEKASE